jgi:hypothetical protein
MGLALVALVVPMVGVSAGNRDRRDNDGARWSTPAVTSAPAPVEMPVATDDGTTVQVQNASITRTSVQSLRVLLSEDIGPAGTRTVLSLSGFDANASGQITFDGSAAGLPSYTTSGDGTGLVTMTVPLGTSVGNHQIETRSASNRVLMSRTFEVTAGTASAPTAAPTATPKPSASATPAPTAVPTATPTPRPTATPTAQPTATPTPKPSATPTPQPTATPTAQPTATPSPTAPSGACQATFGTAPSTSSDQSSAIASFLTTNRGKTVCFASGATYRVDARIVLSGWSGTILGNGATFKRYVASTSQYSHFRIVEGSNILIDGLNVVGPATLSDIQSRVFGSNDREDQHAFSIESTSNITIRNSRLTNTWGDGVYIRSRNSGGNDRPSTNVRLENLVLDVTGRNGISVISVDGLVVSNVRSSRVSLHGFDAEPNRSTDIVANVRIENSDWRTFDAGRTPSGPGWAIVLTPGYADVQVRNITIIGNTMDKSRVRVDGYSSSATASNVSVSGNRSEIAGAGSFSHIRGFVFSDNGLMTASRSDVQ